MTAFETFLKYFGVVMPFCYVIMGGIVIGRSGNFINLPTSYSLILGCVLILYGIFRCYRAYQKAFKGRE
jgi:prolipoprotein diacylglyceryltransferase